MEIRILEDSLSFKNIRWLLLALEQVVCMCVCVYVFTASSCDEGDY